MHLEASVRPFVCQFVSLSLGARPSAATSKEESLPVSGVCMCVCNQWACADYCADAVDRLLI